MEGFVTKGLSPGRNGHQPGQNALIFPPDSYNTQYLNAIFQDIRTNTLNFDL